MSEMMTAISKFLEVPKILERLRAFFIVFISNPKINLLDLRVLYYLLLNCSDNFVCTISNSHLSSKLNKHYNSISRSLKNLEEFKYITIENFNQNRIITINMEYINKIKESLIEIENKKITSMFGVEETTFTETKTTQNDLPALLFTLRRDPALTQIVRAIYILKDIYSFFDFSFQEKSQKEYDLFVRKSHEKLSPSLKRFQLLRKIKQQTSEQPKQENQSTEQKNLFIEQTENTPAQIRKIFEEYGRITGKKIRGIHTKTYKETVKSIKDLIKGKLFNQTQFEEYKERPFKLSEIQEVFRRLETSMKKDYYPANKNVLKIPLKLFLYNPFATKYKSWFLYFYEHIPKKLDRMNYIPLESDLYPELTKKIRALAALEFYHDKNYNFTNHEENKLRKASSKLFLFFSKNKHKIHFVSKSEYAEILFKALKCKFKDGFSIGNLVSDYTFNVILPGYLKRIGCLKTQEEED